MSVLFELIKLEYYRQRATAELTVSEAPNVGGYPDTPGIWSPAQLDGWKKLWKLYI